ncbi:MAG: hypothetical protein SOZ60_03520, partial [Prevotella sp.]|nr:hypothetical protein [Prevotella sp.]
FQSFAWTVAKLCVGGCKALRGRLQSFALAHAMLCVPRWAKLAQKSSVIFWIRAKGGKTHHTGHYIP